MINSLIEQRGGVLKDFSSFRPVRGNLGDVVASPVGSRGGELLRAVASRMDGVTYAPGNPRSANVLTLVKRIPRATEPVYPEVDLSIGIWRTDDHGTLLKLLGVLDAVTAAELRARLEALVDDSRDQLTFDLSGLKSIDSVGVGLLVSIHKHCARTGGLMRVIGLREQPLGVFRLLRLDRLLGLA